MTIEAREIETITKCSNAEINKVTAFLMIKRKIGLIRCRLNNFNFVGLIASFKNGNSLNVTQGNF